MWKLSSIFQDCFKMVRFEGNIESVRESAVDGRSRELKLFFQFLEFFHEAAINEILYEKCRLAAKGEP